MPRISHRSLVASRDNHWGTGDRDEVVVRDGCGRVIETWERTGISFDGLPKHLQQINYRVRHWREFVD